jgi:hypothetical protein
MSGNSLAGPESAGGVLVTVATWPAAVALLVAMAGVTVGTALAGGLIVAGTDKLAVKVPLLWLVSEKVPERRNDGAAPTIVAFVFD